MRLIPILLMSVALATSAGCFGKDDGGDTTTTPTPTGTTPTGTTPTGTTPTTTTPAGGNTTPPAKPAAREVYSGTATFQHPPPVPPDPANPGGPPIANPMPVPAMYTKLTLNVTWALGSAPVGAVASELKVQIVDATGAAVGSPCTVAPGPQPAAPAVCTQEAPIPPTGGEYVLQTSGDGTLSATISVMAS